jgi:ribosome modulation factor
MKVRFTLEALTHIAGIHFYIENRSHQACPYRKPQPASEQPRIG